MTRVYTRRMLPLLSSALLCASCSTPAIKPASTEAQPQPQKTAVRTELARETAAARSRQIANVSYTLWFGLDEEHEDYQGRVVISFMLKEKARSVSSTLPVDFSSGKIHSVLVNGLEFTKPQIEDRYDGQALTLRTSALQNGANRIEISFTRKFSGMDTTGLRLFKDEEDDSTYIYTRLGPYDAHRVFPCFDQPDLKAAYELAVETPADWITVANTLERDSNKIDGRISRAFPPSPVLSTYLFALHAGPYKTFKADSSGIPLRILLRRSFARKADVHAWLKATGDGIRYFNEMMGYPYPFTKYDQVFVPGISTSDSTSFEPAFTQSAGAVTFPEEFLVEKTRGGHHKTRVGFVAMHELAHMWFGNLVTMRWWNATWLNEGLATFFAAKAVENALKSSTAWEYFHTGIKTRGYAADTGAGARPVDAPVPDTGAARKIFDDLTYGKGAALVRGLEFFAGEEEFKEGIQRFLNRFAFRNAAIADLIKHLSEASGKNLVPWQQSWLQTSGTDTVRAEWACTPDAKTGKETVTTLSLKLTPPDGTTRSRPHRAKIAFYKQAKGGNTLRIKETFDVYFSNPETPVPQAAGKPCPDAVFPNSSDLDYIRVKLDDRSAAVFSQKLKNIEAPLDRLLVEEALALSK